MKSPKTIERLVSRFVDAVNVEKRERLLVHEVPVPCRRDPDATFCDWQIVRSTESGWVQDLEERAQVHFPAAFRSLISNYLFPSFDRGPIAFYAVGLEEKTPDYDVYELRAAFSGNRVLPDFLLPLGLVPFARPDTWDYDPLCFDFREKSERADARIVRVDHEDIFLRGRLRITDVIAPSFAALLDSLSKP
jgi:hypothetical protein